MIRLGKLTDYGFVVLTRLAVGEPAAVHNARDLAGETHLPLPTVSKLLKILAREGLLIASRGVKGGYRLARRAEEISAADVIHALEGPIAMTECLSPSESECILEDTCPCKGHWDHINHAVQTALETVTLKEMASPVSARQSGHSAGPCACHKDEHGRSAAHTDCRCEKDSIAAYFQERKS